MVSRKIIKYAVAFRRNAEFGHALGYGEDTNPMYAAELAHDYSEAAIGRAGLSYNPFLIIFRGLIYNGIIDKMILERERRKESRKITDLIPTGQARATRIKQARHDRLETVN